MYSRLELVKAKIEACERFLEGDHPQFLKVEAVQDLLYWQAELKELLKRA